MKYFTEALRNFDDIKGKMKRKDYWIFVLINLLFFFVLQIAGTLVGINYLGCIYIIFSLLPFASATARRMHDAGKGTFWLVLAVLFPIGTLFIIYYLCRRSA